MLQRTQQKDAGVRDQGEGQLCGGLNLRTVSPVGETETEANTRRANSALEAMMGHTDLGQEIQAASTKEERREILATYLVDLSSNMRHLAEREGVNFDMVEDRAREQHKEERRLAELE